MFTPHARAIFQGFFGPSREKRGRVNQEGFFRMTETRLKIKGLNGGKKGSFSRAVLGTDPDKTASVFSRVMINSRDNL